MKGKYENKETADKNTTSFEPFALNAGNRIKHCVKDRQTFAVAKMIHE